MKLKKKLRPCERRVLQVPGKVYRCFTLAICLMANSSCSTLLGSAVNYSEYDKKVIVGATKVYDLTTSELDFAHIYFDSKVVGELGLKFHRFSVATHLNGVLLRNAGTQKGDALGGLMGAQRTDGHQALRVPAGKHSVSFCYISVQTNGLGGGSRCGGVLREFTFEKDTIYRLKANSNSFVVEIAGSGEIVSPRRIY